MLEDGFWYKVAAFSFGAWAIFIPIGVAMIRASLRETSILQKKFLDDFHEYVLQMERRVVVLEQELKFLQRTNGKHDL